MKELLGLALMVLAMQANAGNSSGNVTLPAADQGAYMFSAGIVANKPGCAVSTQHWVFSTTDASGKAMLATVLTAYALGKRISVVGKGSCDVWGDRETVRYLWIEE